MSYHNVASRLAAEGRGPDTMLVHMAPEEVRGLNELAMAAGGSLTINPTTGLPEAGFLKSLLPMVIGAALTPLTGGLINPMTAGLLVGGFETARTGDIGKGLMAGLGAYGGAGLGAGLMGAGASAGAQAGLGDPTAVLGGMPEQAASAATNFGTAGQGLSNLTSSGAVGEAARSGFMSGVGGASGLAKYGLAAASPILGAAGEQEQSKVQQTPVMNRLEYQANPLQIAPQQSVYENPGANFGRERQYFAPRFIDTGEKFTPGIPRTVTQMPMMASGGEIGANSSYPLIEAPPPSYDAPATRPHQMEAMLRQPGVRYDFGTGQARFAEGGISHLGGYSDGGRMLRGPGDGVSDSIPATIGDKQPARLADGEFVVPARIVSELGNGSSEAGARKLYAMMDRVQNARKKSVGDGKVAVDSKAEKHLPA